MPACVSVRARVLERILAVIQLLLASVTSRTLIGEKHLASRDAPESNTYAYQARIAG